MFAAISQILILCFVLGWIHGQTTKSDVAFVIDDTASMQKEINQVKSRVRALFKAVTESKNSNIDNFILITFNDYEDYNKQKKTYYNDMNRETIKLRVKTRDPDEFLKKVSEIKVGGGGRCPELSITGIKRAVEECSANSYIYVFTDASAKDYTLVKEVANMAQSKSIQITFLLTGICTRNTNEQLAAYKTLANAVSGEVFDLQKQDITEVTNYIIKCIESRKTNIGNVPFNPGTTNIKIRVDSDMKNLSVSVNVDKNKQVNVNINDPQGKKADTTNIVNKPNSKVVGIEDPKSGVYVATVDSTGSGMTTIKASISIDFQYGFSAIELPSMTDTRTRPIKGENSYLYVKLEVTNNADAYLKTVQINDINGKNIRNLSVRAINQQEKIYITPQFQPPDNIFKVAIVAVNQKDGKEIVRNAPTPVTPQEPTTEKLEYKHPTVTIDRGPKIDVKYDDKLVLICKIKAYPKPEIVWEEEETGTELLSTVAKIEEPYDYISVLVIEHVKNNNMYKCRATSDPKVGAVTESIKVETTRPNYWNILESPKDTTINYGDIGKIYCKIDSWPPVVITWHMVGKELTNDADFAISDDKTTLVVKNMRPELEGNYFCRASNDDNLNTLKFFIKLSGIDPPEIDKIPVLSKVIEGSKATIPCRILKGLPTSKITWEFKRHDASDFSVLYGTDQEIVIDNVNFNSAGIYKCHVKNFVGEAFHETKLEVQYPPEIDKRSSDISANEGSKVTIACRIIKGIPEPQVTWEFKEKDARDFVSISDIGQEIHRDPVDLNNAGVYKCRAKNMVGEQFHEIKLTVQHPPEIDKSRLSIIAKQSSKAVISCRIIKGVPEPDIRWEFKRKDTSDFVRISETSQEININPVDVQDAGIYKCLAKNSLGQDFHETELTVQCLPEIDKTSSDISANEGSKVTIACRIIKGIPEPQVTWEFKEKDARDFVSISDIGQEIHRDPVDLNNAGVYKCRAKNMVGEQFHEIKLTVQHPPEIDKRRLSIIAKQNSKAVISCRIIKGVPEPDISWEFKRKDTSDFVRISEMGQDINVNPADVENAGIYKCLAKNSVGEDFHETELIVQYRPEIEKTVSFKTVTEGVKVVIPCRITRGFPKAIIAWEFKMSDKISFISLPVTDEEIIINSAELQSSGVYKCTAKNLVGEDFYEFTLNVQCAPQIDKSDSKIIAKQGARAVISCRIQKGVPDPKVSWEFKRKDTSEFISIVETNNEIVVDSADLESSGIYRCKAKNIVNEDTHEIELIVQYPPVINKSKLNQTAKIGSRADLSCRIIQGNPAPLITWKFKRKLATEYISLPTKDQDIQINPVDRDSVGYYKCEAKNIMGQDFHEIELTVEYSPTVEVETLEAVKFGDKIVLTCDVTGVPKPNVRWLKDNVVITSNNKYTIFKNNDLSFVADLTDKVNFTCEARNTYGSDAKNITVDVYVPVQIDPPNDTPRNADVGSDVELLCEARGNPTPSITWKFFSWDITVIPGIVLSTDKILTLKRIQAKSSGIYTCTADNGYTNTYISYEVNVLVPVEIEHPDQTDFSVVENDLILKIPCRAKGSPMPTVQWSFNSHLLAINNGYFDMDEDNTLIIKNPDMTSEGTYTCIATSADKKSIATQAFTVKVLPYPDPSGPMDTILVEENTSPEIECKVPHSATDTLRWYTNGKQIAIKPTNSELKILNAAEKDAGIYTCRVSNSMGSESAHVKIEVGMKPTFKNPRSSDVVVVPYVNRRKVNLDCEVNGKPTPTITWYQDNIKLPETSTKLVFEMTDRDIAVKRCEANNAFGTISRSYEVKITGCTVDSNSVDNFKFHPLLVTAKGKLNEFENQDGVMTVPEKDIVEIVCPNNVIHRCYCSNNDFIDLKDPLHSKHYKYENLKCNKENKADTSHMSLGNKPCSDVIKSRLIQIGYHTLSSFTSVYDVCLDVDTKTHIFVKYELNRYASDIELISKVAYDSQYMSYPYDDVYDCNRQGYGPGCCYLGRQLVSQRDVPPGLQKATFYDINVLPLWNHCGSVHNWDEVEKRIRDLAKSVKYKLILFSGGFQYETKIFRDFYGKNYDIKVPKYLWKVVQINERSQALAIITINIPNLTEAEAKNLVFCDDICDLTDWMQHSDWHMADKGYVFCCNAVKFAHKVNKFFKMLFKRNILYSKNII